MNENKLREAIETVIKRAFPSYTLRDLSIKSGITTAGDNFVGVLYALDVQLENENGGLEKRHLVLKTSPESTRDEKEFADNLQLFDKEISFYCDILPELQKFENERSHGSHVTTSLVKVYDTSKSYQTSNQKYEDLPWDYLLMPDLREEGKFRMGNRDGGLDFDHCKLVMTELAKYHALTYAYMRTINGPTELFTKFPLLKEGIFTTKNESTMRQMYSTEEDGALRILAEAFPIESEEYQQLHKFIKASFPITAHFFTGSTDLSLTEMLSTPVDLTDVNLAERERKERNQWLVMTHGDPYVNNFLFQYTDENPIAVKLIDFQLIGENCLTMDIAYFFYLSTTVELRSEYLNQLLGIYYDAFKDSCSKLKVEPWADFKIENLIKKYKTATIYGASTGLGILPNILRASDPEIIKNRLVATAKECFAQGLFD